MDIVVWLSFGFAAASVLLLIAAPFARRGGPPPWMPFRDPGDVRDLLDRKESLLRAIKDVEFEHQNGTLSQEDRDVLRAEYKARAVEVIRRIEERGSRVDRGFQDEIEAEIAAERGLLDGAPGSAGPQAERSEET